jgi:hypothetical protein
MPAVSTESSSAIRFRSSEAIEAASALRASAYSRLRSFASAVAWRADARAACSYSRLAHRGLSFHSQALLLLALTARQLALQISPQTPVLSHLASRHASDSPSKHTVTDSHHFVNTIR